MKKQINSSYNLPLGIIFGIMFGFALNNVALGISLGLVFGIALKNDGEESDEEKEDLTDHQSKDDE